jgi:hypothetical protein
MKIIIEARPPLITLHELKTKNFNIKGGIKGGLRIGSPKIG